MKKIFTLITSIALGFGVSTAQGLTYDWALQGGGAGADRGLAITKDASGNVIFTGVYQNTATLGSISLSGAGKGSSAVFSNNLYLSKTDENKNIAWAVYTNEGVVNPTGITTINNDVVFVGNMISLKDSVNNVTFVDALGDKTTFAKVDSVNTKTSGFIGRANASGKILWIKRVGSTDGKNDVTSVISDEEGNIYITGNFDKDITLPGGALVTANSTQSSYIAKLNGTTGEQVWIKGTSGGLKKEDFSNLAFDGTSVYVAGTLTNNATAVSVTIGGISLEPSAYPDIFFAKLSKEGDFAYAQLVKHTSAAGNTFVRNLTVNNDKLYLSGSFKGVLAFGSNNIASPTNLNGCVAAFEAVSGDNVWAKSAVSSTLSDVSSVIVGQDKLLAYGYFYNKTGVNYSEIDFGNSITLPLDSTNSSGDLFVTTYSLDGTPEKAEIFAKGTGSETSIAGATSVGDNVYLFATFNSPSLSLLSTPDTFTTFGGFDFLLAKYTLGEFSSVEQEVVKSGFNVYAENGVLVIDSEQAQNIQIYNLTGSLVIKQFVETGKTTISLSEGIYIVRSANSAVKVILQK